MKEVEKQTEPPSFLRHPVFMIGQDSRGNWVARDQSGARGGLFANRMDALKFARAENGNRAHAVVMVSGILELDIAGGPAKPVDRDVANDARHQLRVA
jgi:hypothetical protein